jgi:single-strand DNA-binding protein
MSRGLNKIQLIGNLGRDPEMRFTPSGKPVTEFTLAVNRRRRGEGEAEETDWFRIICWDRLAEIADQFLSRGTKIFVEGRLQIRRYTSNDGQERTAIEVVANDLLILTPRGERGEVPRQPGGSEPGASEGSGDEFDDVPF